MPDREKVIREIQYCTNGCADPGEDECNPGKCRYAVYQNSYDYDCKEMLMKDALALLKDQEARVMTLKELQAIETPWNRNTPPYLFVEERYATRSRWLSWGFIHDCVRLPGTMGMQIYGSKWRVWNLQPTPEQMRETKWEGEKDAE